MARVSYVEEKDHPELSAEIAKIDGVVDFRGLFLVPLLVASGAAVALALFFRPPNAGPGGAIAVGAAPH